MRDIATASLVADSSLVRTSVRAPKQSCFAAPPTRAELGDLAVVAARLMEAARLARDGNCEAAKAQVARAMALLRGEPTSIPTSPRPLSGEAQRGVLSGFLTWKKRRLTAYIDDHLADPIRIADLAGLLDLSESHFSRAFRCTFGTSAHEYVTRRRIEIAQSLMLKSSESLCSIALRCGLCDQSHFTRVFRRIVGETPYAWRRTRSEEFETWPTERSSEAPTQPARPE